MGTCSSSEIFHTPEIEHSGSGYNQAIIDRCPLLTEVYRPPALWGRHGNLQAAVFCSVGRKFKSPDPNTMATLMRMEVDDGTTVSFEMFQRCGIEVEPASPWLLLAPGICNNGGSDYVLAFVHYVLLIRPQWRVAVLNHLGSDHRVPLTSGRTFSLGCTEPYDVMVQHVRSSWPEAPLVAVGFSMGANIILKYLGEEPSRQKWFKAALSCCQGYGFTPTIEYYARSRMMRFYSSIVARRVLQGLKPHRHVFFTYWRQASWRQQRRRQLQQQRAPGDADAAAGDDDAALISEPPEEKHGEEEEEESLNPSPVHSCNDPASRCHVQAVRYGVFPPGVDLSKENTQPLDISETSVYSCYHMGDLDREFFAPMNRYASALDYLAAMSSSSFMHNITDIPVLLFNADDDPIAPPEEAYQHARKLIEINERAMFVHTRHGSHMAFYNGGWLFPSRRNIFDQILADYIDAVLVVQSHL